MTFFIISYTLASMHIYYVWRMGAPGHRRRWSPHLRHVAAGARRSPPRGGPACLGERGKEQPPSPPPPPPVGRRICQPSGGGGWEAVQNMNTWALPGGGGEGNERGHERGHERTNERTPLLLIVELAYLQFAAPRGGRSLREGPAHARSPHPDARTQHMRAPNSHSHSHTRTSSPPRPPPPLQPPLHPRG